jgi:hypothetical protein
MHRFAWLAAVWCAVAVPTRVRADAQDFSLYQLGNPKSDPYANARFAALMNELGVAIVNWNLEPAETTGFSGFSFGFEYPISFVNDTGKIGGSASTAMPYWAYSGNQTFGNLQMPGFHIRKGLPFSFEAGVRVNYLNQSNMVATMVEVKWALNEGFLYFPDLGVRGFGTQLIGARDFQLTVAGFDISVGHQFPVAGMFTITPYAGWNLIWVAASSGVIDFNPGQSEQAEFGDNASGTSSTNVFNQVSLGDNHHNRFYGGVRFISYIVEVSLEANYTDVETDAAVGTSTSLTKVSDSAVITYAAKVGLDF